VSVGKGVIRNTENKFGGRLVLTVSQGEERVSHSDVESGRRIRDANEHRARWEEEGR
jgi:hypothetical protein